jgi:hypothetical protein
MFTVNGTEGVGMPIQNFGNAARGVVLNWGVIVLLIVGAPVEATVAPNSEQLIGDLSTCDKSFFTSLGAQAKALSANPMFRTRGALGYFAVADREDQKLSMVRFVQSEWIGPLEVVGYFDESFGISTHGKMISWGFLVNAPIEKVFAATRPSIWDAARLRSEGPIYVRSEIWIHANSDLGWQKTNTVSEQAPAAGTVERVLLIEPYELDATLTRFGCSLQGDVTREMMNAYRPDVVIP